MRISTMRISTPRRAPVTRAFAIPCLAASLLLGASLPAQAQDRDLQDLSRKLDDPVTQAGAATALSAMVGALLSVDIAPFTRAMRTMGGDRMDDLPRDATLGDLAGPAARDLPRDIARRTPQAMGALSGTVGSMEHMLPQLRAMGRNFKEQMDRYRPRREGDNDPYDAAPDVPPEDFPEDY